MNIKSSESSHGERTREQILCAAEELFAEKGFSQTSIRDITEKAECNLAAVNYYFHGKENLYTEVFRLHMSTVRDLRINAVRNFLSNSSDPKTLEALLQIFATTFLEPFLKKGSGQKLMELMMRERYDSHLPPHMFVEEIIQPTKTVMKEALSQIHPELTDTAAELCIHSIVGQLFHIMQAQELFKGMDKTSLPVLDLPKAVEHIVKFSAGGIRQYLKKRQSDIDIEETGE